MSAHDELALRSATCDDFPEVERLFAALHAFNASLDYRFALSPNWRRVLYEYLERVQSQRKGLVLLAWRGRQAVGLLIMGGHTDSPLFLYRRWAELIAIYVDPAERAGAVARTLLEAGSAWAREHHYDRIQLYVTASNERARAFYRRMGFSPVQEIWRLDLAADDDAIEPDEAESAPPLLSMHPHELARDSDEADG